MTDLKDAANPNSSLLSELTKATNDQNELLVLQGEFLGKQNDLLDIQIVLLDRLCTLKEQQQNSDDSWRVSWWKAKVLDTRVSIVVLFIAVAGVSFDVIQINGDSAIINSLLAMIN